MTNKPSYLGLLNAISNAETEAEGYLTSWAEVTRSDDVRTVLTTIALREGEHGKAFAKRICELGFAVVPKTDAKSGERAKIAGSTKLSDLDKFNQLDLGRAPVEGKPDIFSGMFADATIDIQTGALLGRYIAEERDSGRLFQACREQLEGAASSNGSPRSTSGHANGANGASNDRLDRIEKLLDCVVEKLNV